MQSLKTPTGMTTNDTHRLSATVSEIIATVKRNGDSSLFGYSQKFDGIDLKNIEVTYDEIEDAEKRCDDELLRDMDFGIRQITSFAEAQKQALTALEVEPIPGLHLGHRIIPIDAVGCYVPGGRYPLLSSAQMTIIPAKVAGVKEICVCTPPKVHPAVLLAAHRSGATRIFRSGGAQAIAALAYGTETIPAVDKIVGPGNAFVNEAKRQVFGPVGIDQLAGPSEIYVVADETGDAKIIAADLLGQAEHDIHARAGLISTSREVAERTISEVERQLKLLSTAATAGKAWAMFGEVVVCDDEDELVAYANTVAPEHLEIHTKDPHRLAARLTNYGSLFIGTEASVVFSDKVSGTNHTLPTGRAARYSGGLWVGSFLKVCTHQWLDRRGVDAVAPVSVRQSEREGLEGHLKSARLRLDYNAV